MLVGIRVKFRSPCSFSGVFQAWKPWGPKLIWKRCYLLCFWAKIFTEAAELKVQELTWALRV